MRLLPVGKATEITGVLQRWLKNADRIVVVGVGNELRRDDFVGVEVVRRLKNRVSKHVMLIESETVPENFIEPIVEFNPTRVLIIDAGLLGLESGDARFLEPSDALGLATGAVSTHSLPLKIFCEYLGKATSAKIALIVIQPKRTDFGEGLSSEIKKTAEKLARILQQTLKST
jgi:hydrogenase 3 maturation protease